MATKITTWSPDTCGCQIEYAWDDVVDPTLRVHTWDKTVKTCPPHIALVGAPLFTAVMGENNMKNDVLGLAIEAVPTIEPSDYTWSFDGARMLLASFDSVKMSAAQKTTLQGSIDTKHGAAKVFVS